MIWLATALAGVSTASHDGHLVQDRITWTSTYVGERNHCVPLSEGQVVERGWRQAGLACAPNKEVVLRTEQVFDGTLAPPLVPEGVHRVTLKGSHFRPTGDYTKTVGGWSASGVTRADRMKLDTNLRRHGPRALRQAIYVRNPTRPVPIELLDSAVSPVARVLMFAALGLVLLGGALAYKVSERFARRERIEGWMKDGAVRAELQEEGIR